MVVNIDENVGRVLAKLKTLEIERNTIVIFMTDNGPGFARYNAGMRGAKGTQYQGGIRVPFFMRWPGRIAAGREIPEVVAHIDVLPTLLQACGIDQPASLAVDGRSFLPLIGRPGGEWPDRMLCFQWHPGEVPEPYWNCAVRDHRFKLVDGRELYDLAADPGEKRDVADKDPEVVSVMRRHYERWFEQMEAAHHFAPPRIQLGTEHENPATLTRQDFRGPNAGWQPDNFGYWEVEVRPGRYEIKADFFPAREAGFVRLRFSDVMLDVPIEKDATACVFPPTVLKGGQGRMDVSLLNTSRKSGARYVHVKRV